MSHWKEERAVPDLPRIPETITVHLGPPDSNAPNVTLPFPDYIKNVASSEVYPTWPESAIRANIYAQISFALNRVYTEFYRSRGYPFDITGSTAYDQAFVNGRDVFENVGNIVDEIFDSYVRRQGFVEPLFTSYCDGIRVQCGGLSQWGTVSLAGNGLVPYEILQYYYGRDIDIVNDVPVSDVGESAPIVPLRIGTANNDVALVQTRLNRISANYPAIPKIATVNGIYNEDTEAAVRAFQRIFGLGEDGIVGKNTWYRIAFIYNGVKRLSELNSEGLTLSELPSEYPEALMLGMSGPAVRVLQYYLSYIAQYVRSVPSVALDGVFGPATRDSVIAFQNTYGLPADGIVGEITWNLLYNTYLGMIAATPIVYTEGRTLPFPGRNLSRGDTGDDVRALQEYLGYVARYVPDIPAITADGIFGAATEAAVEAFQRIFVPSFTTGIVGAATWNDLMNVYSDIYVGNQVREGQYPGYTIS
ncbi:MAG: peptidoglycan-binding protein [Clostridia bacterium]|nr:peptidoglycan-binding protein [Clostridia bacterium]